MKRFGLLIIVLFFFTSNIQATTYTNFFPAGKNYLDPLNLDITDNVLTTIQSIKVRPNQDYVLSMPGIDMVGSDYYIVIEGDVTYIDEYGLDDQSCHLDEQQMSCHFITTENVTVISLYVYVSGLSDFYSYYQTEGIQLEEGTIPSDYEMYIAPDVDMAVPEFDGSGAYIKSYETFISLQDIITNHITAYDEVDGDLSNQIAIEQDTYTNNEQIVGEYPCLISVTDSSLNKAYFNLTIIVKDTIPPIIQSETVFNVEVDAPIYISEVLDQITYSDGYTIDPVFEVITDTLTGNEKIVGTYQVEVRVTDDSQNQTTQLIQVNVNDQTPPVIESSLEYVVNVDQIIDLNELLSNVVITDNYDSNVEYTIVTDGYTGKKHIGTYFVDLTVTDSSNNQNSYTVTINIIDDQPPVIAGVENITASYQEQINLDYIMNLLTVSDNYSQLTLNDLIVIEDTYTTRASITGEYDITFKVVDSSNNSTVKTIHISIFDDINPVIYLDEYIVILEQNMVFSEIDAFRLLILNHELEDKEYDIEVLNNEYSGNEHIKGSYLYRISFTDSDGDTYTKDFVIEVEETIPETTNQFKYISIIGFVISFGGFVILKSKK